MTTTKYGHYILTERGNSKAAPGAAVKPVVLEGIKDWGGVRSRMKWKFIMAPGVLMDTRHSHEFDEFLVFLSCNPVDETDFSAEFELQFGKEGEPRTITAPSVICLPQGLVHGPLTAKKVGKPVLFAHIYLAPDYKQVPC